MKAKKETATSSLASPKKGTVLHLLKPVAFSPLFKGCLPLKSKHSQAPRTLPLIPTGLQRPLHESKFIRVGSQGEKRVLGRLKGRSTSYSGKSDTGPALNHNLYL